MTRRIEIHRTDHYIEPLTGEQSLVMTARGDQSPAAVPESDRVATVREMAETVLEAVGWLVPDPLVHADRPIPFDGSPKGTPAGWFDASVDALESFDAELAIVDDVGALTRTLEGLIADGILPIEDDWYATSLRHLRGQEVLLIDRMEAIDSHGFVDRSAVLEAFARDRDRLESFAHALLCRYLESCLDARAVSPAQAIAYAGVAATPMADTVVLCTGTPLRLADVRLAMGLARDRLILRVSENAPPTGHAWSLHPKDRLGLEGRWSDADVIDHGRSERPATQALAPYPSAGSTAIPPGRWAVHADDPVLVALDLLEELLDRSPLALGGAHRLPTAGDIGVVAADRPQARRLLRVADDRALSLARVGSVEIFRCPPAIMGLAWLRVLTDCHSARGWTVILDHAGYSPGDIATLLKREEVPAAISQFLGELGAIDDGLGVLGAVADSYGFDGRTTAALLTALTEDGRRTRAAVRDRIDHGRRHGRTIPIEPGPNGAITVSTRRDGHIHDKPVAIHLRGKRPPLQAYTYLPPLGLRATKRVSHEGAHVIETRDPAWQTLQAVLASHDARERAAASATISRCRDHAIVVGPRPSAGDHSRSSSS